MEKEVWKAIPGIFLYEAGSLGNIRSFKYKKSRILKPSLSREGGYLGVVVNGKYRRVHRLIAAAFHGLDLNDRKQIACHRDDDPLNNREDNIFIGSQSDNVRDMIVKKRGYVRPVLQFDKSGKFLKKWDSIISAVRELGIHKSCICVSCSGNKTAGGFIWKYQ